MIELFNIDMNYNDGSYSKDAFISILRNKNKQFKFCIRFPLVFKNSNYYDPCIDRYVSDVWCTPYIVFTKKYPNFFECYYGINGVINENKI